LVVDKDALVFHREDGFDFGVIGCGVDLDHVAPGGAIVFAEGNFDALAGAEGVDEARGDGVIENTIDGLL
jgi:hypothetical protein